MNPDRFTAYVRTDTQQLTLLPAAQETREAAEAQLSDFMRFMSQFAGGTQAVLGWVEPVVG